MKVLGGSDGSFAALLLYPQYSWRVCIKTTSPVCSAPLRGFNPMPDTPISIIDFHGLLDSTIPPSPEAPDNLGPGPDMTTETWDGYYYHIKLDHLAKVSQEHCRFFGE